MTSQQRADEYLTIWRGLRAQGVPAELRLPIIDSLIQIELAKMESSKSVFRANQP